MAANRALGTLYGTAGGEDVEVDDRPLFDKPIDDLVPARDGIPRWKLELDAPRPEAVPLDRPADEVLTLARRQRWLIAYFAVRTAVSLAYTFATLQGWIAEWVGTAPEPLVPVLMLVVPVLLLDVAGAAALSLLAARALGPAWAVSSRRCACWRPRPPGWPRSR